jgi:hypothetical protein
MYIYVLQAKLKFSFDLFTIQYQKILIDPHGAEAIAALATMLFSKEVGFFRCYF